MPHAWRFLAVLLAATTLAGCIYPVHKTLQPAATVRVVDGAGQRVPGANVTLVSASQMPVPREVFRMSVPAGNGTAEFRSIKDWRVEFLAIGGIQTYRWTWCVTSPGHQTLVSGPLYRKSFDPEPVFALEAGEPTPCPSGPEPAP